MNPLASPHGRATSSESAPSPFVPSSTSKICHILFPLLSDVGGRTDSDAHTARLNAGARWTLKENLEEWRSSQTSLRIEAQ